MKYNVNITKTLFKKTKNSNKLNPLKTTNSIIDIINDKKSTKNTYRQII